MDGLLTFLIFGGFFYLMMRFGCGAHAVHGHHGGNGATDEAGWTDPVCGMKVERGHGYARGYQGHEYRFCSRACLDQFDAAPERYMGKQQAQQ